MKLTLIRHGRTEGSEGGYYYGPTDLPVLEESLAELRQSAGHYPQAPHLYTSTLLRTQQTAQAIYGRQPFTAVPELQEMNVGDFEMKTYAQLKDNPDFQAWCEDSEHLPCPNGESVSMVRDRALRGLAPIIATGEDAVCVVHGGVICCLMNYWFGGLRFDFVCRPGMGYTVILENEKPVDYKAIP